jgi:hypothetical protein
MYEFKHMTKAEIDRRDEREKWSKQSGTGSGKGILVKTLQARE